MPWAGLNRDPRADVRTRRALDALQDTERMFLPDSIEVDSEGRMFVVPDNSQLIIAGQVFGVH
jgi:hypothetical protein